MPETAMPASTPPGPERPGTPPDFAAVETWVFDLDNTLYAPGLRLVEQINARITAYIIRELGVGRAEADRLRAQYWREHGITLTGLIAHHGVPADHFLDDVHDIDLSALRPDPRLNAAIARLPGRRVIHTNGARAHAERVLRATGLEDAFEAIYGIEDKALVPKPHEGAYAAVRAADGFAPDRAAMIEDTVANLEEPKRLGMATVWLCHTEGAKAPAHVDRRITRLATFLEGLA
ncbi:MAG: pyrimidine 5'-nucleotidase [Pseudomonadota bacterium]